MSTRVKGITIEFGADASGLEKALKGINQELGSTQRQLTSVNKSLKLDPNNIQLVEQKQRLLAKAIDETESKLQALKKAQSSIDTSTENGQAQYDALTREISDTEAKLKNLNKEQKEFQKEANAAQASASGFNTGLKNMASACSQVAEKTKALSAAAAGALAGLVGLAVKAGQTADEWAELSQKIGLSTDTIQKFQYASDRIDVEFSAITGAITRMKGNLDSAADTFDSIGVKVKNQRRDYRDIESIFFDTVRALSRIENETERDTVAMDLFGKKANELAGIIDDGGKKLQELGQEAESLGLIVSEEDIENLNEFNDTLDGMKAQIKAALVQLAIPVMEELRPIIAAVANAVKKVASELANANPVIIKIVSVILLVIAAISPVASLIANVSLALLGLSVAGPMAAAGLSSLLPYVALIAALAVAGAALGYAIGSLVNAFEDFKAETGSTSGAISAMIRSAASGESAFAQLASVVVGAFNPVGGIILNIAGGVAQGVAAVKSAFEKMSNIFENFKAKALKFGSDIINSFANGIKSAISNVISAVQRLINAMSNLWSSAERDASSAGSRTAQAYVSSYNSTTSTARLTNPTRPSSTGASTGSAGGASVNGAVASAINNLANSISNQSSAPTTVNVELVGSAKNIFDTVRVQNSVMQTATGYHALA